MEFTVVEGDVAAQSVDAVVNAAGTSLRMGSGVAGALRRAGGEALNEAAVAAGPVELGGVAVTGGFDLDADYVVHAAAMPHYGDGRATAESVRSATRGALAAADERGCRSLAVPALGCGVAGFPLDEGARIIAEEIRDFEPEHLADVRFVAYGSGARETIARAAATVRTDDGG